MADATYNNQNVYHKQGGDEEVVASGGKITVESGGEVEVQSGGFFDLQTGADFRLTSSNNTLSAAQLRNLLWAPTQFSVIANSTAAAAGVLSVVNLPSAGVIIFSITDGASNASAWLTSNNGVPGQIMILMMRGIGSTGSIHISMSGVSLVGTISGDVSSIKMYNSSVRNQGASTAVALLSGFGYAKLLLTDTDEWSIIERSDGLVEQGSS